MTDSDPDSTESDERRPNAAMEPPAVDTPGLTEVSAERASIRIPLYLAEHVERRLASTQFTSKDEYVTFALTQLLQRVEEFDDEERADVVASDPDTSREIEEQLESLGYL